jgi:hypothetical protein
MESTRHRVMLLGVAKTICLPSCVISHRGCRFSYSSSVMLLFMGSRTLFKTEDKGGSVDADQPVKSRFDWRVFYIQHARVMERDAATSTGVLFINKQ